MSPTESMIDSLFRTVEKYGWEDAATEFQKQLAADDPATRALRSLVQGWIAVERVDVPTAREHFQHVADAPLLTGWVHAGEASMALRLKDYRAAERAIELAGPYLAENPRLAGTVHHIHGSAAFHQGQHALAQSLLLQSIEILGDDHYNAGRSLDALGAIYASKDNFLIAQLFFSRALQLKQRVNDKAGLAVTHGQLGRLNLEWGNWSQAESHFREDLRLAQVMSDEFGQMRMYGSLGQVMLAQADDAASAGQADRSQDVLTQAADWLETCIRRCQEKGWSVYEGFARKDLALAMIGQRKFAEAEVQLARAEALFTASQFKEGLAHWHRASGVLLRMRFGWSGAQRHLQAALAHFDEQGEVNQVAITRLEMARCLHAAKESRTVVSQAFLDALHTAESSRRTALIKQIESEMRSATPEAYWIHMFQRVRGRSIPADGTSLIDGARESATIFFLDLEGSTDFARSRDPQEVMMSVNQMMADVAPVLRQHSVQMAAFCGDGFLALVRGSGHAERAVASGLGVIAALREFNEPRRVLKIPLFKARIGISSGEVLFGNVGTYDKLDYSGVGVTMNLAARLQTFAQPGMPCISQSTYELVRNRFTFAPGNPRQVNAKGLDMQTVWDVAGPTNVG